MIVWMKDKSVSFKTSIDEKTGFLHVEAVIARTGIQKYLPSELGDEGSEAVGVFRSEEQVTQEDSIKSFTNVPVTDNHPNEMVNIENFSKYSKGSISSIVVIQLADGITALKTNLVITDKSLIESIRNGKKELSVGYENILLQKDGTHNGEDYKYIQTDIRANHVAVVDEGRCGGVCKLMIDNSPMSGKLIKDEGGIVMKITINGKEFDVSEEVASEIKKLQEASKKASEDMEEEKEVMKESNDKLQATVDVLSTSKSKLQTLLDNSSDVVDSKVEAKISVLAIADAAGIKVKTTDSILSIKQAIVKSFDVDTADKSEIYLDACIDMHKKEILDAKQKKKDALDSIKKVGDEYTPSKTIDIKAIENEEIGA